MERNPRTGRGRAVLRVVLGNFLEMYDFSVYGFYAAAIAGVIFPSGNAFVSLMLSLGTFGAGFLMRPLGAIVLGAYIDRHGRRAGLILSLALMSGGVVLMAVTPGYATIGLAAPLLVLLGRLLQGFSAGAESSGVSVYLAEISPPGRRGFFVSWQSASQQVSVIFAAVVGVVLSATLTDAQTASWGWRVPFLIGSLIVPFLFWVRRGLRETDSFTERTRERRPALREVYRALLQSWPIVLNAVLLVTLTSVMFYLITTYTPTFGEHELGLTYLESFVVTVCVGVSNLFWIPVIGAISDRVGRVPPLAVAAGLTVLTAYPVMLWLTAAPSFTRLLLVLLWLSLLYGGYQGAMVVTLTEIMPASVRATGFALAYSLAQAIFGGFTPAISTGLIHVTGGQKAMPGAWLSFAAAVSLAGIVLVRRTRARIAAAGPAAAEPVQSG